MELPQREFLLFYKMISAVCFVLKPQGTEVIRKVFYQYCFNDITL